jgi:hypothetical protein
MNELSVVTPTRRLSPKLALAILFGLTVALGNFAAGSARADDDDRWHRDHREYRHHDDRWGGVGVGVYAPPPVIYADPNYGYYPPPPPVVYGPPGVGFSVNIR